ncbi:MAG TPA: penicillin-binding transpeptidase domain-containing protein [Actinophytocola sp.]|uniref:penicillin-binding transpeptidase domain-containing protein n=1 Tax=Actinophytocola sp. TaxID=1872138 RepID=UPI002DBDD3B3|nr:penicillin-binding transpeptidase domain-containing protein [Actinophytocola sp.]HEU5471849.1 penicillin-binding transpeptidase domain-containing protein [Actinophytocola sp.]
MTPLAKRWVLGVLVGTCAVIVTLAVVVVWPTKPVGANTGPATSASVTAPAPPTSDVAGAFLAAFAKGDATAAAALTDDPQAAAGTLSSVWRGLAPQSVIAERAAPDPAATEVPFTVTWTFGPQRVWTYPSTLSLTEARRVRWTPALVHPKLAAGHGLVLRGSTGQPAVLDRDGTPLLVWQADGPAVVDPALAPLLLPAMARVAREQGGANGWHVALTDAAGTELERLAGSGGEGKPLASVLSIPVQRAAQAAVDSVAAPARLVAIKPSTGDILAVAQNGPAGAEPRALNGLYPPGSTFKIATATAALQAGVATPDTVLPCPGSLTIGQRTIPNDNGFALGDVPLHSAFARSCNTTFGQLAADLGPDALSTAAGQLGLNADFTIPGLTTEAGAVEPAQGNAQKVENGIGQGTVRASPFGVALMSATVASGRAVVPRLWRDLATEVTAGYQPPPRAVLDRVRAMMREVVTAGTATAIGRRGAVFGKTGTAQFGDGSAAHGWFTGYRGDLAFAVLVESAGSSAPAVAASSAFLGGVG